VKRPPLVLVFVAILMIALGQTAGAVMSQASQGTARLARARILANAPAHGLAGSREYDDEVLGIIRKLEATDGQPMDVELSERYLTTSGRIAELRLVQAGYRLGAGCALLARDAVTQISGLATE